VFRSADGGVTWEPYGTGLQGQAVWDVTTDPSVPGRLYAGSAFAGVFRTLDGVTWAPYNEGLARFAVYGVANVGACVYAATYGNGVHKVCPP
jgi:hypothetical protein